MRLFWSVFLILVGVCSSAEDEGKCDYFYQLNNSFINVPINSFQLRICTVFNCDESCFDPSTIAEEFNCFCYSSPENLFNASSTDSGLYWGLGLGMIITAISFPIIIFFNVNLASGPSHSFVFFYQCVPLIVPYGKVLVYFVLQNQIYDNCLYVRDPLFARFYFFEYFKYIVVAVEVLLILFLIKCSWCPLQKCRLPWAKTRRAVRNFREKHVPKHTVIHGICSVVLLAYGDLLAISSLIILNMFRTYCYDTKNGCPQLCVDIDVLQQAVFGDNATDKLNVYKATSIIVLLLLLPLPLSLIYYPTIPALFHKLTKRSLPRFPKLDPVFDVFQGVYKDKMRWFAGVHLLYRMILWVAYLSLAKLPFARNSILIFCFLVILIIHSLFQPFKKPKHNYLETLYLLNLIVVALYREIYIDLFQDNCQKHRKTSDAIVTFFELLSYVPNVLYFIPLVVVVLCYCVRHRDRVTKPFCHRCTCNRFSLRFKSWHRQEEVQMTEDISSSEYAQYTEAEWSV